MTVEREVKTETPVRESTREPTPREKSVKHSREEKRERQESPKKQREKEKDKEKRRDKRATSPPTDTFEGDLSSVSNSSNGSMHPTADVVIVDDQRGKQFFAIKINFILLNFILVSCRIEAA